MQRDSKRNLDGAERNSVLQRGVDAAPDFAALHPGYFLVMPALVEGIHVFTVSIDQRRGWLEQVRP
jgi:hypothetical protein